MTDREPVPVPTPENPFRTTRYIAKVVDVKEYTVREWLRAGTLKGFQGTDGQWRVLHSDFVAFLQERFGANNAGSLEG